MKANEFRLGSFFGYKGCIYAANVIRDNFVYGKNVNGFAPGEFPLDKINPIPLTEEWLLKFGFEKAKHSHGYNCYIKDGFDFDIVSHGRYLVLAIYTDESCTNSLYFAHNRFEYVHQFQNLSFALTGEELILNEKL